MSAAEEQINGNGQALKALNGVNGQVSEREQAERLAQLPAGTERHPLVDRQAAHPCPYRAWTGCGLSLRACECARHGSAIRAFAVVRLRCCYRWISRCRTALVRAALAAAGGGRSAVAGYS